MNSWEVAGDAVVAVIAAAVAVRLSLSAFYSQKWWERKAEAYSGIMAALSRMERHTHQSIIELETNQQQASDTWKKRFQLCQEARDSIEHETSVGSFIVSDEVVEHLITLRRELNAASDLEPDWHGVASAEYDAIVKAMNAIRSNAKQDLKRPWYRLR